MMRRLVGLLILGTALPIVTTAYSQERFGAETNARTPVIQEFDGVLMALVPAGCFMMGSDTGSDDELPIHQVCIETAFWIDVYEVTNAQFEAFNGVGDVPSHWDEPDSPREQVTWVEARNFCLLRGGRLPTEAEWEYAARGPEGWQFPWGNVFNLANLNIASIAERTLPVGSFAGGVSWVGAHDMAGNVWEWVNSVYMPYPYDANDGREDTFPDPDALRGLRGGGWSTEINRSRAAYRGEGSVYYRKQNIGFRCAMDVE